EIKQTNQTYRPYSQATSVLCTLDTCLSYLGPSQAPNLGTETNLKLSTYTGHIANTYIHTQGTTQGTKTRHTEPGTQNKANGVHTARPKTLLLTSGKCFTCLPQQVLFCALYCLSENVSLSQSSSHANEAPVKIGQPLGLNWTPPLTRGKHRTNHYGGGVKVS